MTRFYHQFFIDLQSGMSAASHDNYKRAHRMLADAAAPIIDLLNDPTLIHKPTLIRLGAYWRLTHDLRVLVGEATPIPPVPVLVPLVIPVPVAPGAHIEVAVRVEPTIPASFTISQ